MSPINTTRRHILKSLLAAGLPGMTQDALEDACRALQPTLLSSDFRQAVRELSAEAMLDSATNPVDRSISWGLTTAGEIAAKRI